MALSRRDLLLATPALTAAVSCAPVTRNQRAPSSYVELAAVRPSSNRGTVVVCMPNTSQTREVWAALSDELGRELELVAVQVEGENATAHIAEAVTRHRPTALVLMNNPTLTAYGQYQRQQPPRAHARPGIAVMASFLDERPHHLRDVTGISYEVPLITVITNLRKLIQSPIERIGVVRRNALSRFVGRQSALARREKIRVIEAEVGANPNPSELKRALRNLKQRCDAIWVLNDDHLLSQTLIAGGWLPGLNERPWVPVIVGAQSLVSPANSFGTFAMLPDHTALGVQAANLVFDIANEDWSLPAGDDVELPLSTLTVVDLAQARERFSLREDALTQVDRILE
ncbi:MAG TPA: hypothetical protein VFQ61_39425 [Polyangiaceae bacterium]|nr:hypothetical protein [Polyangiaceae bacterium]